MSTVKGIKRELERILEENKTKGEIIIHWRNYGREANEIDTAILNRFIQANSELMHKVYDKLSDCNIERLEREAVNGY